MDGSLLFLAYNPVLNKAYAESEITAAFNFKHPCVYQCDLTEPLAWLFSSFLLSVTHTRRRSFWLVGYIRASTG